MDTDEWNIAMSATFAMLAARYGTHILGVGAATA